jgi:hypothetical protein
MYNVYYVGLLYMGDSGQTESHAFGLGPAFGANMFMARIRLHYWFKIYNSSQLEESQS